VVAPMPGISSAGSGCVAFSYRSRNDRGFGLTVGKLVLFGGIDEVVGTIRTNIRHLLRSV